jgi:hypothetical protein
MLLLTTHGDGATWVTRGVRTQGTTGTALTVLDGELDLDHLSLAVVDGRGPTDTRVAFGAGGLLGLPIEVKLARLKAHLLQGLPFDIGARGAYQINTIILLTAVQQLGINIARIDDMLLGQQFLLLKPFMDAGSSRIVGDRSCGRFNMGDQMRAVFVAGFR